MSHISPVVRWLVLGIVIALCIAPTFISYRPYRFRWDDSVYLLQSIKVSRAFWVGNENLRARLHETSSAMYSDRPPAMTLLGVPWGPLASWDAAGKCFVTLGSSIAFLVSCCLFLMARIGVKPLFLFLAALSVFAALCPWPPPGSGATALMADGLFAWTCLAALLLIPYEARTEGQSVLHAALRGVVWGLIFSLGVMTKINFLYFAGLIIPVLLAIRYRRGGFPCLKTPLIAFVATSAPAGAYLFHYGRSSLRNGQASSFGGLGKLYAIPLLAVARDALRLAPGLCFYVVALLAVIAYIAVRRRSTVRRPDLIAVCIALGFGLIVLASPNLQVRYAYPAIVSLPFLIAVMLSAGSKPAPRSSAGLMAGVALIVLLAAVIPTRLRAQRRDSLGRADAVVAHALPCRPAAVLLATDSDTLNDSLLAIAFAVTRGATPVQVNSLAWQAVYGHPIREDFGLIDRSDVVVFQDSVVYPRFTNSRDGDYKRFLDQQKEFVPVKVWSDVTVYTKRCGP